MENKYVFGFETNLNGHDQSMEYVPFAKQQCNGEHISLHHVCWRQIYDIASPVYGCSVFGWSRPSSKYRELKI